MNLIPKLNKVIKFAMLALQQTIFFICLDIKPDMLSAFVAGTLAYLVVEILNKVYHYEF